MTEETKHLVCVVIPLHKSLSAQDIDALMYYKEVFFRRDVYCVVPEDLDEQTCDTLTNRFGFTLRKFKREHFVSAASYNKFMTMKAVYRTFADYEYMLIVQLDARCFRDDLDAWCKKGYDYIGAPWCHHCHHVCRPDQYRQEEKLVGNGGLCLRKIQTFLDQLPEEGLADFNPEDEKIIKQLKLNVPTCGEALQFSVESYADRHVLRNGVKSMGIHNVCRLYPWLYDQIVAKLSN